MIIVTPVVYVARFSRHLVEYNSMLIRFLLKPGQSVPIAASMVEAEVEATHIGEAVSTRFLRILSGDGRPPPTFRRLCSLIWFHGVQPIFP